jgi:hypothetical protein
MTVRVNCSRYSTKYVYKSKRQEKIMGLLDDMSKNADSEMAKARVRQQIAIAKIQGNYDQAQKLEKQLYKIGF